MKYWSRFPVFRVLIPFASGILFSIKTSGEITSVSILTIITTVVAWLFTIRNYATGKFANRWLAGIPIYACFLGLGFVITWLHKTTHYNEHFHVNSQASFYLLRVKQPSVETPAGYRIYCEVIAEKSDTLWKSCRGNVLLYLKDTSHIFSAGVGDKITTHFRPDKVKPPLNPNAFDYSRYLESKGIGFQGFVGIDDCAVIERSDRFSILQVADGFRKKLLSLLEEFLEGPDRLGVAGALLLGYEEWLDPELENQYSAAGVLHILCVSGMHVGLIYLIFSWAFSWMKMNPILNQLRFPLMIALIWFYSLVTGLAPSIIRAATMISFMIGGKWLDKNSSIYNTLCSSCIVMFVFDPYLIVSAGFQLSFLAVCGIVIFHQMIFPLWNAPNKFLHKTWELISISISAQLSTFPLSLFLFHQFPNYFIIGNLLLIPLSTFVMYSGIVLLITAWIPNAGLVTGYLTSASIDLLNYLVIFISKLPGSVTENISISFWETILVYLLMLGFTLWIVIKTRTWLFAWMSALIVIFILRISTLITAESTEQFTVYHHKESSVYSIISNRKAILFSEAIITPRQLNFTIGGNLLEYMVRDTMMIQLDSASSINYFQDKKLLIIRDWKWNMIPDQKIINMQVEVLVLGGNIDVKAETILKYFQPQTVVIDASVKSKNHKRLKEAFTKAGLKVHQVKQNGAFTINW